mmetsp:Transcript_125720/g.391504  ORF Transcript_125720/g.391504 Transcript_125720/m.391504 type:complete len:542 (-) Transcript_125720:200-1825(-)
MPVRSGLLERWYTFEYDLGQWTFGTTQVLREKQTNELKTCKTVPKALVKDRTDVFARLQRLRDLSHPFLCRVTDVLEDPNYYFIISDACNGGDLGDWMDRLDKNRWWIVEETVAAYTLEMAAAVAYCHSHQVYHRDLRPSSIQLSSKMPDATILVSDFGIAEILDPDYTFVQRSPNPYAAPELRSQTGRVTGGAPDVWSIGAITYALLIGHPPHDEGFDLNPSRLLRGAPDRDAWANRSITSHDLVHWLLRSAGDRPTAARIMNHRWLKRVVVPSSPSALEQESNKELQTKLVCYMIGVLLVPAEVSCAELRDLRAAFIQADHDYDGLLQQSAALELLLSTVRMQDPLSSKASSSSFLRAEVEEALQAVDVRGTGVADLCSVSCAAALVRARAATAGRQAPGRPQPPRSPTAKRLALADELLQRALDRFIDVYRDANSRSSVPVTHLSERLHCQSGHEMETCAGVNYDEMLTVFREVDSVDRRRLASELAGSSGRGTPLAWGSDAVTREIDIETCWEPPLRHRPLPDECLRKLWPRRREQG